jgi:hypothetical protein
MEAIAAKTAGTTPLAIDNPCMQKDVHIGYKNKKW